MKIAHVKSYQTSDGQLHPELPAALTHEAKIDLRGLIQNQGVQLGLAGGAHFTASQVAEFVVSNADTVAELLRSYREKMRRAAK